VQTRLRRWAPAFLPAVLIILTAPSPLLGQGQVGRSRTRIEPVSKGLRGAEVVAQDRLSACPGGALTRDTLFNVRASVISWQCDDGCSREFLRGVFEARVAVTRSQREEPGRGCFEGRWAVRSPEENRPIASGTMRGTVGVGTHDVTLTEVGETESGCERCEEPFHFEGVLEGRMLNPARCRGPICATIQGRGLHPRLESFAMRAEGTLTVPCVNETPEPAPTAGRR
jgi:hypothetical protein